MRADFAWSGLALRLAVGAAGAVVVTIAGRFLNLAFAPVPTVVIGLLAGVVAWFSWLFDEPPPRPAWEQPHPPPHGARFAADVTTRRLATMLARAQPGSEFETGAVARVLTELVERRLVRNHDVPADDPVERAHDLLSPELLAYARAARADKPRPLTRRALHAHLKEIDQL
ncbi:hypothetical protein LKO27_13670 [Tessaracoccus sp. OS52]|uniref:hypothetical protein n=1 Tax=Tessaracoccus sp. OS52 TaxID=2886691 RepID=UPI001D1092DF|nr:hypothetical protein [Tessaracoccus sp. OS52]MCC2594453.1 hypothetical protein [Tessaracoccus sp. OS52]